LSFRIKHSLTNKSTQVRIVPISINSKGPWREGGGETFSDSKLFRPGRTVGDMGKGILDKGTVVSSKHGGAWEREQLVSVRNNDL
jgi:hypothetical protein